MENRKVRDANVWRVFKPMGIMRWFRKMLERERERGRERKMFRSQPPDSVCQT
jgi:hypothetical protein